MIWLGILIGWVSMFAFLWWWAESRQKYYDQKLKDMNDGNIS